MNNNNNSINNSSSNRYNSNINNNNNNNNINNNNNKDDDNNKEKKIIVFRSYSSPFLKLRKLSVSESKTGIEPRNLLPLREKKTPAIKKPLYFDELTYKVYLILDTEIFLWKHKPISKYRKERDISWKI